MGGDQGGCGLVRDSPGGDRVLKTQFSTHNIDHPSKRNPAKDRQIRENPPERPYVTGANCRTQPGRGIPREFVSWKKLRAVGANESSRQVQSI